MYIEEIIKNKNFFHYINLYNCKNIKLLQDAIITEVPFLEIDKNKMLSFNDEEKYYIKGTTSDQLQEYVLKQNVFDYMKDTNEKYISNNFYDKFFHYNNEKNYFELFEYNKSINKSAYLGLFPFTENPENYMINSNNNKKNNINFLLACEINSQGVLSIKSFNEKLLSKILGKGNYYTLRFKYNSKNLNLIDILENLYLELNLYLNYKKKDINKKSFIKEIDKLLTEISENEKQKEYIYQDKNKINFLFYENENLVNNNLYDFYKKNFLDNFEIRKIDNNGDNLLLKYKNSINNKNLLNIYFKLIDKDFNFIEDNVIFKYKNTTINFNNFNEIKNEEELKNITSIIYIINLILKRKNINKDYNLFITGNDEYLSKFALNIGNINYKQPLKNFINIKNINFNKQEKFKKLLNLIDSISKVDLKNIFNFITKDNEKLFNNKFSTYNVDYLIYLKKEVKEAKYKKKKELYKKRTVLEKIINFFTKSKEEKDLNIVEIDNKSYYVDKIENSKIGNKIDFDETILDRKINNFIDLNSFNDFTFEELFILYIKSILKSDLEDNINKIYSLNKEKSDFILPVMYGKSNVLIDKINICKHIDNIIIDKPDLIPVYYLFPILYSSSNIFTYNNNIKRVTTSYWASFDKNILNIKSNNLKNKISLLLKLNNEYINDNENLIEINKKINFINFTKNEYLLSIQEFLQKIK